MNSFCNVVSEIRRFNRFYTNILGLLNQHILDSSYSLTEVRLLLEIGQNPECAAHDIMKKLNIDKGYLSRILKRFTGDGLIAKKSSVRDGRAMFLHLTPAGKELLSQLENKSDSQVMGLIRHLNQTEQEKLVGAMRYIETSLTPRPDPVAIRGFQARDVEYVIRRHREMYLREYGFLPIFGDYVATTVAQFASRYDPAWENLWIADQDGQPVGVIAVVKVDERTAQLRWFLIEPEMRGRKLGRRLIETALEFSREKDYKHIFLWTVNILGAARHLYQSYGFTLTETRENSTWMPEILLEERWDLDL